MRSTGSRQPRRGHGATTASWEPASGTLADRSAERLLPIEVLLIEDSLADAHAIQEKLSAVKSASFCVTWVLRLSAGLDRLVAGGIDVILLDLSLPDSQGFNTFGTTHACFPGVPIVVLADDEDDTLAVRTVRAGAEDCLLKSELSPRLLSRSIHYAIERRAILIRERRARAAAEATARASDLVVITRDECRSGAGCQTDPPDDAATLARERTAISTGKNEGGGGLSK